GAENAENTRRRVRAGLWCKMLSCAAYASWPLARVTQDAISCGLSKMPSCASYARCHLAPQAGNRRLALQADPLQQILKSLVATEAVQIGVHLEQPEKVRALFIRFLQPFESFILIAKTYIGRRNGERRDVPLGAQRLQFFDHLNSLGSL